MSDTPIAHVADTAFWVATYRANESARPDALFKDPLAARLAAERGRDIAEKIDGSEQIAWVVVMRTCIIDDLIREAIGRGCDTVLNLGAGLDTRPYRLELPSSLRWGDPRTMAVLSALGGFAFTPKGFTNRDLRERVAALYDPGPKG